MSIQHYGWFSYQMLRYTNTIYIYKDGNGNDIQCTIISNTKDSPMICPEKSVYKDFKCLGKVYGYSKTISNKPKKFFKDFSTFQKKMTFPKPLTY